MPTYLYMYLSIYPSICHSVCLMPPLPLCFFLFTHLICNQLSYLCTKQAINVHQLARIDHVTRRCGQLEGLYVFAEDKSSLYVQHFWVNTWFYAAARAITQYCITRRMIGRPWTCTLRGRPPRWPWQKWRHTLGSPCVVFIDPVTGVS